MSISKVLPNEILINVINNMDSNSIHNQIAEIPELKGLITIVVDLELIKTFIKNNDNDLTSYFNKYQFVHFIIDNLEFLKNDQISLKLFKIIRSIINKDSFHIKIDYLLNEIDLNYLKNFKSSFINVKNKKYLINFPNLSKIKINSNHLLLNDLSNYQNLESLNLYYCSSNFLQETFHVLNPNNHNVLPSLKNLKIQDYMNESEDVYLKTSDNYKSSNNNDDDDYDTDDEFDHNSDFDENEFYFDGLEILQNINTYKLESLSIKNANLSLLNNMNFTNLINLKIISINDKHIDAYDIIDSEDFIINNGTSTNQDINPSAFKSGTQLQIMNNNFPALQNLIIIGNINIKKFRNNTFKSKLNSVFIKYVDQEITTSEQFHETFAQTNKFN